MNLFILNDPKNDEILSALSDFKKNKVISSYFRAARGLLRFAMERAVTENTLFEYVVRFILSDGGLSESQTKDGFGGFPTESAYMNYVRYDIETFMDEFLFFGFDELCDSLNIPFIEKFPKGDVQSVSGACNRSLEVLCKTTRETFPSFLINHVKRFGCGDSALYCALTWNGESLVPIKSVDPIRFENLTGLDAQKEILIDNTRAFLNGRAANNVLLTGGAGTGKSSCIKACLNMFSEDGLKLVEVSRENLITLPALMKFLAHYRSHFIIFIDDLSFESGDMLYKSLKTALDGQMTTQSGNVLIYATSNRRHLIRESWNDRQSGVVEEIHKNDTVSEKLSLSSRFGINLYFLTPNQTEYIEIVKNLLKDEGVEMTDEIKTKALSWELNYNGRSGRTAKQFVRDYLAQDMEVL